MVSAMHTGTSKCEFLCVIILVNLTDLNICLIYFILISHFFSDNPNSNSNIQLENHQALPSDNTDSLRGFNSRAPRIGDIDSDDTSDDEFILYVDDDKKHILKS